MEGKSNQNQTNMLCLANTIWISRATYMLTEISADLGVVIQHEQNKNQNGSGSSTFTYLVAEERDAG
jgi:hypothetical protein